MKVKATGLLLALAMMVGMFAGPAAAATSAGPDAGVFFGQASVGKSTNCTNTGGTVSGAGLGITPFSDLLTPKTAFWAINATGSVQSLAHGTNGNLSLCGDLNPRSVAGTTLGASCEVTNGDNGQGRATFSTGDVVWISDLGWIATAGGTFVVTGQAGGVKGKTTDLLVAAVQALDELVVVGCTTKSGNKSGGATVFNVVAAYSIIQGAGAADDEADAVSDAIK